jgi:hypothetical protein
MFKMKKITSFQETINSYVSRCQYVGKDKDGQPIYDKNKKVPPIIAYGSVKIHGTNGGVALVEDKLQVQSKSQVLALIDKNGKIVEQYGNNAGFVEFVQERYKEFFDLFNYLIFKSSEIPTIFGEFAGKGIQKGVGVSELDKFFYVFGIKFTDINGETRWEFNIPQQFSLYEKDIYTINDVARYSIRLNFNMDLQNTKDNIQKLVSNIEECCPVAIKVAEIQGVKLNNVTGEGLVWYFYDTDGELYMFKTKGDKHTKAKKTKFKVEYTPEELKTVEEFVSAVLTEDRLEQGLQEVFGIGQPITVDKLGKYIKWIMKDVGEECKDELKSMDKLSKKAMNIVMEKAKEYFFSHV